MKRIKILLLILAGALMGLNAAGQANASINILTQNLGQVTVGGVVYVQIDVGNTGPTSSIGANKVRARLSVPIAIVSIPASGHVLPPGWSIVSNTGDVITVCNGSDIIGVNEVRSILIAVQGNILGGPSTVTGVLLFSNGTNCNVTGTLPGDQTADNTSTSVIEVISAPSCTLGVSAAAGTIACNGGTTTLTATTTGANGTVQYSITGGSPFQSSNTFTVGPGTYTITAREISNPSCMATSNAVTVTDPPVVTAPTVGAITQPSCAVATGSVLLSGLPTGNWTITGNPGAITVMGAGASTTINGLASGTYTFTVTNAAGCTSVPTGNVTINAASSIPAAPTTSITQPTCTVTTGTITITSTTVGLTFSLDGGTFAAYPSGGYVVTPGAHTLTAQNASGCNSPIANVTVNAQPATPTAPTPGTITQPNCIESTGSVVLNGLPATNWTINPGNISGNTTSTTLTGLAPGTYAFTVTNTSGCVSAASPDVTINNVPGAPPAPTVDVAQPNCTVATGTITITSATTGLTFSLDGGAYTAYPASGYVVTAGAHMLIAENSGGCNSPVTNITVNPQPATPAAPTVNVMQPTCLTSTGTIIITSVTTDLMFSIDGGAYGAYPAGGYVVAIGNHTLAAQNTGGCTSGMTNVTINAQPAPPTVTATAGTVACNGGTTTLTVTINGGVAPFEYSLNGGTFQPGNTFTVGVGTYTVTVRDVNLCSGNSSNVTVVEPAVITASASANTLACGGGSSTITVAATGGTAPLQYSLNGGVFQPGNTFTVAAGTYNVTVRDANLCTKTTNQVTITQAATLTASANAPRITQCGGTTLVTVSVTGGVAPYTGTGSFAKGPGTWSFIVRDAGGCGDTARITIEAPGCMDLKVFPNPTSNSITINHSIAAAGATMQVFDMRGSLMISQKVPQDAFQTTIDVSKLAGGRYALLYINGNEKKRILFNKVSL